MNTSARHKRAPSVKVLRAPPARVSKRFAYSNPAADRDSATGTVMGDPFAQPTCETRDGGTPRELANGSDERSLRAGENRTGSGPGRARERRGAGRRRGGHGQTIGRGSSSPSLPSLPRPEAGPQQPPASSKTAGGAATPRRRETPHRAASRAPAYNPTGRHGRFAKPRHRDDGGQRELKAPARHGATRHALHDSGRCGFPVMRRGMRQGHRTHCDDADSRGNGSQCLGRVTPSVRNRQRGWPTYPRTSTSRPSVPTHASESRLNRQPTIGNERPHHDDARRGPARGQRCCWPATNTITIATTTKESREEESSSTTRPSRHPTTRAIRFSFVAPSKLANAYTTTATSSTATAPGGIRFAARGLHQDEGTTRPRRATAAGEGSS